MHTYHEEVLKRLLTSVQYVAMYTTETFLDIMQRLAITVLTGVTDGYNAVLIRKALLRIGETTRKSRGMRDDAMRMHTSCKEIQLEYSQKSHPVLELIIRRMDTIVAMTSNAVGSIGINVGLVDASFDAAVALLERRNLHTTKEVYTLLCALEREADLNYVFVNVDYMDTTFRHREANVLKQHAGTT